MKHTFKVGDRVTVRGDNPRKGPGTVSRIRNDSAHAPAYEVSFDDGVTAVVWDNPGIGKVYGPVEAEKRRKIVPLF